MRQLKHLKNRLDEEDMKRTQVGDVYAFKTERGYRIIQWGYFIEKHGNFVRVFPNFYEEIPPNMRPANLSSSGWNNTGFFCRHMRRNIPSEKQIQARKS